VITLVLGGTRSGKSEVAERLAARAEQDVTYIATGITGGDDDFDGRVARHRARRPPTWSTLECGTDAVNALAAATGTVVLDSLGSWVAAHRDFVVDTDAFVAAVTGHEGDIVIVSDEVGLGVHPATEVGRRFRDVLGEVNRSIADIADEVLLVVAGRVLPLDPLPLETEEP
jgi:adenosylcobinamide kinase/adenosylcobinamide-phosphate guanylyltransferase